MRTAVVFLLIIPMAASSAMMALRVEAGVSPGTAIMSSPTEQTQVMASSLSRVRTPSSAARIMPASSLTGMKAPVSPPTWEVAMAPPFLTASFKSPSAAVVPWVPHRSSPMASRISATESPQAGVGARERSTMPKGTPRRCAASRPTSSPIRVILKAVRLISSASTPRGTCGLRRTVLSTTPGPLIPTLITCSASPVP